MFFYLAISVRMELAMRTDETYKPKKSGAINISDRYEVEYWAKKLGVGRDEVRWAVQMAGPSYAAVREAIRVYLPCDRVAR